MNAHTEGPFELNGDGAVIATLGTKRTGFTLVTAPMTSALVSLLCRNRRCVNPDHLEAVTAVENARRKPVTVITPETASAIRRLRSEGLLMRVIASRFGVSRPTVSLICSGKTWQEDR